MTQPLIRVMDAHGHDLGHGMTKDAAHPNPDIFCLCAHVWIYNDKGEVLLQKRSPQNRLFPNLWDISAAGHVDVGEDERTAIQRELHEELGIAVRPTQFGKPIRVRDQPFVPDRNYYHNEFIDIYFLKLDTSLSDLTMQTEEVADLRWLPFAQFTKELHDPVTKRKYVPHSDNYYRAVLAGLAAHIKQKELA